MKNVLLAIVAIFTISNITIAQEKDSDVNPEPVETGENYEVYGNEFPDDAQYFALNYLIENSSIFEGQQVATTGKIKEVCQKKGCFFILTNEDEDRSARITFKDYEFFIPTNSAGNKVRLVGEFKVNELSEEKAKHYAEDAGEDPEDIEGAQQEYGLIATSVKIIKN